MSLGSFNFFIPAFIYMILSLQVSTGFPSFYLNSQRDSYSLLEQKQHQVRNSINTLLPHFVALSSCILLWGLTQYKIFAIIAAFLALFIGFDRRKQVKKDIGHPQKWLMDISPITNLFIVRYPMGIYDLWTLGIFFLFGGMTLLINILQHFIN